MSIFCSRGTPPNQPWVYHCLICAEFARQPFRAVGGRLGRPSKGTNPHFFSRYSPGKPRISRLMAAVIQKTDPRVGRLRRARGLNRELFRSVQFSFQELLLHRNVKRFRGGLVFKAHRLVYHSTLGLRVIQEARGTCFSGRLASDSIALRRGPNPILIFLDIRRASLEFRG